MYRTDGGPSTRRRHRAWSMLLALAAVVIGLAASTAPAQAYPAASCQIAVKPQHVQPGHSFTVSGHSDISEQWTVTFQGSSRSFVGSTFSTTLRAPATAGTYRLGVSCSGANGSLAQQFGIQVASAAGSLTHGSLPNTGASLLEQAASPRRTASWAAADRARTRRW